MGDAIRRFRVHGDTRHRRQRSWAELGSGSLLLVSCHAFKRRIEALELDTALAYGDATRRRRPMSLLHLRILAGPGPRVSRIRLREPSASPASTAARSSSGASRRIRMGCGALIRDLFRLRLASTRHGIKLTCPWLPVAGSQSIRASPVRASVVRGDRSASELAVANSPRRLHYDIERRHDHPLRFPPITPAFRGFRDGSVGCPSTAEVADRAALIELT